MKIETRLVMTLLIRLVFLFFAGWVALVPDALPGAHLVTRIGLAAVFLVVSILVGEAASLHTQFEMLVKALRAAGAQVSGTAAPATPRAEAIPILIRALGSSEADTREKAHRNLVRISGEDHGTDRKAWDAWWAEHADRFA